MNDYIDEIGIWRPVEGQNVTGWEIGEDAPSSSPRELTEQLVRLRLEIVELRGQLKVFAGNAAARLQGRVCALQGHTLTLVIQDALQGIQGIRVHVPDALAREELEVGLRVDLVCSIIGGGRLVLDRIRSVERCDDPLPEPPVAPERATSRPPEWFDAQQGPQTLLKASDSSSSVSALLVHLVWATKRRGKVLTAAMVERLKFLVAEVVQTKGLGKLLAVNAESDHVHVALHLPANVSGSQAAGVIKAYASRLIRREFPKLLEHHDESLWQRGCFVGSIGSGRGLQDVIDYIANQEAPED